MEHSGEQMEINLPEIHVEHMIACDSHKLTGNEFSKELKLYYLYFFIIYLLCFIWLQHQETCDYVSMQLHWEKSKQD